MGTNQPHGLRAGVEASAATVIGGISLFVGAWMVLMTGYFWAAIPLILAGAVAFPMTRPLVSLGRLRVGRRLHDFLTFVLWGALVFAAILVAQPWA